MPGGAPFGNDNASHAKPWHNALDRAIAQDNGKRLRAAAEKLLNFAAAGESWAIHELANRLDGRPAQDVTMRVEKDPLDDFTHTELREFYNALTALPTVPIAVIGPPAEPAALTAPPAADAPNPDKRH